MKGLIATWRAMSPPAGTGQAGRQPDVDDSLQRDEREVARGLADAIERAMKLGLWEHAQRVAESASHMVHRHPHLADRLARLRLAQRDPESALNIIDSCTLRPASLRLLRAICLLQLGQRAESHLDLHEWSRRASAPLQARFILALLEWHAGDADAALDALRRNLRQIEDPRTLAALLLINTAMRRRDPAAIWADRLRSAGQWSSSTPEIDLLLQSVDHIGPVTGGLTSSPDRIAMLAAELQANESVIPALAAAQGLELKPQTATLLKRAIEAALGELDDPAAARDTCACLDRAMFDLDAALPPPHVDEARDVLARIGETAQELAA